MALLMDNNMFYTQLNKELHIYPPFMAPYLYHKSYKNSDTKNNYHIILISEKFGIVMQLCPKEAAWMPNSVDPVWSGSALFAQIYLFQYMYLEFLWLIVGQR